MLKSHSPLHSVIFSFLHLHKTSLQASSQQYSLSLPFLLMSRLELHHGAQKRPSNADTRLLTLSSATMDDGMAPMVVPPVTVVLEGRSICHRIHLNRHSGYGSLAKALHHMFVDTDEGGESADQALDLSNAVPGYVVAYEDMEDDLLLVGDLNWNDFIRVVKRIRIIPAKTSCVKHCRKD